MDLKQEKSDQIDRATEEELLKTLELWEKEKPEDWEILKKKLGIEA